MTRYWVWLDSLPLAQVEVNYTQGAPSGGRILYLDPDHLNAPRIATSQQAIVWSWNSDAFGATLPNEDVDGDGVATHIPLRFPGQYYDAQTQLSYNYFRDYDPQTGRYVQSDPIGLEGGLNTYGYVGGNPVNFTDPTGRSAVVVVEGVVIGGAAAAGASLLCALAPNSPSCQSMRDIGERCLNALKGGMRNESADDGRADHAAGRAEDAKTDPDRQDGDKNKVIENGKTYEDADTGHTVHVDGDRVVITDSQGRPVTQFKNTRANTNSRVNSGKWIPK